MQRIKQAVKTKHPGKKTRPGLRVKSRSRISGNPDRFLALKDYLQRKYGNYQVGRMAESGYLQAQLKISNPGDVYEREADATADKVMSMPEQDVNRQAVPEDEKETANRQADKEEEQTVNKQPADDKEELKAKLILRQAPGEEEQTINKQPTDDKEEPKAKLIQQQEKKEEEKVNPKTRHADNFGIRPSLASIIKKASSCGEPLPKQTRSFFEKRFRTGFGHVRVHHDEKAQDSARLINARAYTLGSHIVFGKGEYSPTSPHGRKLLAHELTHVVQQGEGQVTNRKIIQMQGNGKGKKAPGFDEKTMFEIARKSKKVQELEAQAKKEGFTYGGQVSGEHSYTDPTGKKIYIEKELSNEEAALSYAYELQNAINVSVKYSKIFDKAKKGEYKSASEYATAMLMVEVEALITEAEVAIELGANSAKAVKALVGKWKKGTITKETLKAEILKLVEASGIIDGMKARAYYEKQYGSF